MRDREGGDGGKKKGGKKELVSTVYVIAGKNVSRGIHPM